MDSSTNTGIEMAPLKWLVVEDDPINRRLAQITLSQMGFKVDVAVNGAIGVDMFAQNTYDYILMDIMMPVMDGIEATTRIRRIEETAITNSEKKVIIIAFTANAFEDNRTKYFSAGMNYYLNKPLDIKELKGILNS
jgi:CheY-like chemotaxis protein